jgi:hypothetical protein
LTASAIASLCSCCDWCTWSSTVSSVTSRWRPHLSPYRALKLHRVPSLHVNSRNSHDSRRWMRIRCVDLPISDWSHKINGKSSFVYPRVFLCGSVALLRTFKLRQGNRAKRDLRGHSWLMWILIRNKQNDEGLLHIRDYLSVYSLCYCW